LNILVCVKQVPDTTAIKIDPIKHTLIREGVPSILNTFDGYALETALRVRQSVGQAKITVLSMGPEQAKEVLKECISVGADEAYLVSDRAFGGSDTLATSCTLATAIRVLEERQGSAFDLIFCGKQAIDGDTAQVGPEISQHLDRALLTYAQEAQVEGDSVKIRRESDEGYDWYAAQMPAVITVNKTSYDLRYPSLKGKMAARKVQIPTLTAADVVVPEDRRGLKGSPTKVKKTFTPSHTKSGMRIEGLAGAEAGAQLAQVLADAKLV
jgi:electron transfer flavoprotein beta subunit